MSDSPETLISNQEHFRDFIIKRNHPCVMAQTVFKMDAVVFKEYQKIGSKNTAKKILEDIEKYIATYNFDSNSFQTFIAAFPEDEILSEELFEEQLWTQLEAINTIDPKSWDASVSDDPHNKNFSFSILGNAFYIVGLHPKSSRIARQAPFPTLVFNLHSQFEKLREMGTYKRVRNRIRRRDKKLQGSINPTLADFGNTSEAIQYSGRNVMQDWKCPFHNSQS